MNRIKIPEEFEIYGTTDEGMLLLVEKPIYNWNDFKNISGYYIDTRSDIGRISRIPIRQEYRNVYPTKELAEAALALCQLLQVRDSINRNWKPNFSDKTRKYSIINSRNKIHPSSSIETSRVLMFKTEEIRDKFIIDNKELLKIALPLL